MSVHAVDVLSYWSWLEAEEQFVQLKDKVGRRQLD